MKLAKLPDGQPEIFHTLQGEGTLVGTPSVFLRLSLCNLHCHWCDTDYTWNFERTPWTHEEDSKPSYRKHQKAEVAIDLSPETIASRITQFPCQHLVITGGEPLLQQEELVKLLDILRQQNYTIEVETNGTQLPTASLDEHITQYNVSPKLSNSKMPAALRLNPVVLRYFAECPKSWFKFAVSSSEDLKELQEIEMFYGIPRGKILLMPIGRSVEEVTTQRRSLVAICLKEGYRFSDRLHLHLFGNKRAT